MHASLYVDPPIVCLSASLCVCPSTRLLASVAVCLPDAQISLSPSPPPCPPARRSVCLPVCPSPCLPACQPVSLSPSLPACLPASLRACLASACLPVPSARHACLPVSPACLSPEPNAALRLFTSKAQMEYRQGGLLCTTVPSVLHQRTSLWLEARVLANGTTIKNGFPDCNASWPEFLYCSFCHEVISVSHRAGMHPAFLRCI